MKNVILIGAGGHARSCIDVIEYDGRFSVAGLIGQHSEIGTDVLGYQLIGTDADLPSLLALVPNALIAVGQIDTPEPRVRLFEMLKRIGFNLPSIISPFAHVSKHAEIGEGTIIMHGATINAGARLGRNCIINSHALIEHDATIGDHCHISTKAVLNGNVKMGNACYVGSGTVIKEGISIGNGCLIGMALSIRHDQINNEKIIANS